MKVIVFTADENNGGIKQFTIQILKTFIQLGHDATLFIPNLKSIEIDNGLDKNVLRYKKQKDILGITPEIINTAKKINAMHPDCIYLTDDSMYSIQVMRHVDKKIKMIMTMHDITQHPNKLSFKRRFLTFISVNFYRKIAFKRMNKIIVLSENSRNRLSKMYPNVVPKISLLLLGAHCPNVEETKIPNEIDEDLGPFFLFFGRIQEYKGIYRALVAFNAIENHKGFKFVVAGNGCLSNNEKREIDKSEDIILINRYIEESEMVWLIKNSSIVVLPYIEASQSGVIPLAYHFGKPIIGSRIDGIIEFTNDNTGFLFNNELELKEYMQTVIDDKVDLVLMSKKCLDFENNYLNWETNLKSVLKD